MQRRADDPASAAATFAATKDTAFTLDTFFHLCRNDDDLRARLAVLEAALRAPEAAPEAVVAALEVRQAAAAKVPLNGPPVLHVRPLALRGSCDLWRLPELAFLSFCPFSGVAR